MRNHKRLKKAMLSLTVILGGSTVMADGCINTLASINICGTVLTFCTPADQLNLLFPYLETPDFETDPSCTIPLGCGASDVYQNIPAGFPGGSAVNQPSLGSTGTGGGGAGGGV
ncbi:MAG: hypothetical protein AABZ08_02190 [Planctomycetota bacterium]